MTAPTTESNVCLIRNALIRGILYCSKQIDFEFERYYVDCSCINNGIPLDLIEKTYQNLLGEFKTSVKHSFIDQVTYENLRKVVRQHEQKRIKYHLQERQRKRQRKRLIMKKLRH